MKKPVNNGITDNLPTSTGFLAGFRSNHQQYHMFHPSMIFGFQLGFVSFLEATVGLQSICLAIMSILDIKVSMDALVLVVLR